MGISGVLVDVVEGLPVNWVSCSSPWTMDSLNYMAVEMEMPMSVAPRSGREDLGVLVDVVGGKGVAPRAGGTQVATGASMRGGPSRWRETLVLGGVAPRAGGRLRWPRARYWTMRGGPSRWRETQVATGAVLDYEGWPLALAGDSGGHGRGTGL